MKFFFVVGEASGDLHAANLLKAMRLRNSNIEAMAWGGDKLADEECDILMHFSTYNTMGFVEVLTSIPKILKFISKAAEEIINRRIDKVILVDFSGFNLRLAKKLREKGFKGEVNYYISPKLWAWNTKRVKKVSQYIDTMYCIMPFEVEFYNDHDYNNAHYIGNPIMDEIEAFKPENDFLQNNNIGEKPIIALLPGSRVQEIKKILPLMADLVHRFPSYQFVMAAMETHSELYDKILDGRDVTRVYDQTYDLLHHAHTAVVASGTAVLETAILNVPQIAVYKADPISMTIARTVASVDHMTLPNLILDRKAVPEILQENYNLGNVINHLLPILDGPKRQQLLVDYELLRALVGEGGASDRAAEMMLG